MTISTLQIKKQEDTKAHRCWVTCPETNCQWKMKQGFETWLQIYAFFFVFLPATGCIYKIICIWKKIKTKTKTLVLKNVFWIKYAWMQIVMCSGQNSWYVPNNVYACFPNYASVPWDVTANSPGTREYLKFLRETQQYLTFVRMLQTTSLR